MTESKKLKNHPYSQCKVIIEEVDTMRGKRQTISLISYSTRVIQAILFSNGKGFIECGGTYSATTRKHIGYFLKEYFPQLSYYHMKEIAGKGIKEIESLR